MSTCTICNGTGKTHHDSNANMDHGGGLTSTISTHWTELCECRKSLPLRHGKAAWWTTGVSRSESFKSNDGMTEVVVSWSPELPVSEDNYPLHRTLDNSHFIGTIEIEIDNGPALTPDGLREIAKFLTEFAAKCEEWDKPVPDEGGGQ